MKQPAIRILGSGNAAWCIGNAFHDAGIIIDGIYSRNSETAQTLAKKIKSRVLSEQDFSKGSGICFICVQDRNIIAASQVFGNSRFLPVHCSGSTPADVLKPVSGSYGVFYPVISMVKGKKLKWKKIPVCIEASSKSLHKTLLNLAELISDEVFTLNSDQRTHLHLAAVFANNFANACWTAASKLTSESGIPFKLLIPLIHNAAGALDDEIPGQLQTGPAIRNDLPVIRLHEQLLRTSPGELKIYKALTNYIRSMKKDAPAS